MSKFKRELATNEADLPHRYEDEENSCKKCGFLHNDPRHVAWERADLHERERALENEGGWVRELGS